jgi:hypothetical protein
MRFTKEYFDKHKPITNETKLDELIDMDGTPIEGDFTPSYGDIQTGPVAKSYDDNSDYEKGVSTTSDKIARYAQPRSWWALYYGYGGTPYSHGNRPVSEGEMSEALVDKKENKISELDKALQSFNKDILEGENLLKVGKLFAKSGEDSFALHQLNAIDKAIKSISGISGPAAEQAIQKLLQQENAIYDKYYSGKPKVSRDQLDTSNVFKDTSNRITNKFTGAGEKALDPARTAREMAMLDKEANTQFIKGQIDKEKELSKILKRQQADYERFANTIAGSVTNAFMGLWDAMEKGQNISDAIGEMFQNITKQLAAAVIQALLFKAIMNAINAGTGGAGEASTGFASLADMIMAGISPHAAGGITTGPSIGLIGEAGPEAIMPLSKLSSFLNTSFNAGSMSSSSSSNGGQFVLRGQDLLLSVNRSQKASKIKGQSISLA